MYDMYLLLVILFNTNLFIVILCKFLTGFLGTQKTVTKTLLLKLNEYIFMKLFHINP